MSEAIKSAEPFGSKARRRSERHLIAFPPEKWITEVCRNCIVRMWCGQEARRCFYFADLCREADLVGTIPNSRVPDYSNSEIEMNYFISHVLLSESNRH
jgi:hypothetical protein